MRHPRCERRGGEVSSLVANARRRILAVLEKEPLTAAQVQERFGVSRAFAFKLVAETKAAK